MTLHPLQRLADRVDRNVPSHSQPERFHEEKSEIAGELRKLAREAQLQGVNNLTDLLFVRGEVEHGVALDEIKEGRT
jgi:hypothetical protein